MKKKNGFVFVETMIVVVVLVSILLIIYSSYTSLISMERRLARYDDPVFVYRTKMITNFLISLKDDDGNSIIGNKIEQLKKEFNKDESGKFINISTEDQDLFSTNSINENYRRKEFFSKVYYSSNIESIIIFTEDSFNEIKAENVSSDFYRYLKSIEKVEDGIYIAIMYAETVNGSACDINNLYNNDNKENSCTYYYSSLEIQKEELT